MSDHATANDHTTAGAIPRDLPLGAFGVTSTAMWGDE